METERLILRHWLENDAEVLFKYASDPDVGPRAGWPPHKSVEESRAVIRDIFSNDHTWTIELKETGEAIGCIGYFSYGESNIGIEENDVEIILSKNDKHLCFWVGIYCSAPEDGWQDVSVTTVVKFKNFLGRLYFIGIWGFHKLLGKSLFRKAVHG